MESDDLEPNNERCVFMMGLTARARYQKKCWERGTNESAQSRQLAKLWTEGYEYNFEAAQQIQDLIDCSHSWAMDAMYYRMKFEAMIEFCKKNGVHLPPELMMRKEHE